MTMQQLVIEIIKIMVSIATPVVVIILGYKLNNRLKSIDATNSRNQKLTEKRIEIFDDLAPKINTLLCYFTYVGDWKEITPIEIIGLKRKCDKIIYVYYELLGDDVLQKYEEFIQNLFLLYRDAGQDAGLKTHLKAWDGDRRRHSLRWEKEWERLFHPEEALPKSEVRQSYNELMKCLGKIIKREL